MKKQMPKVSIIIPVYNGARYMKEAIDSALAQTYPKLEIIVVNDGSNDGGKTDEIALSYGNKIKYYKKENGGVSTALNFGISKMTGEYFSWLSHDDVYYPEKIQEQIEYINKNNFYNEKVILYGDYDLIDEKSRLISEATKDHKMLIEKSEYALLRGSINGITLLIPKKAFDDYGLFDETLRCTQDYELWQRMEAGYLFHHMPGIVAKSRQHSKQVSVTNPKVITEGNPLWINMIESLSEESMIRLEGSVYAFYKEMAIFLKDSPYIETVEFCENKCNEIEKEVVKNLNKIKVSVIIPFYNRIDLVLNAINSVIKQTYKNLEILIIDDGSSEDVSKIKKLITKDKRINYIRLNKNKGASNARNVGIDKATGEYIAFLDSDDLFEKDKIAKQLHQLVLYDFNVSHTSYLRKGFDKELEIHSGTLNGKAIPTIIHNCGIATPTVMIKKDFLDKNNYRFNTSLTIGEDTCFWLEILRNTNILGIDELLTTVNVLDTSAAYNVDKQVLGLKTIMTYVLNDDEYKGFDYEIALLCSIYIDYVNKLDDISSVKSSTYYSEYVAIINSRSWKMTKPLRLVTIGLRAWKKYGFVVTSKKIFNKVKRRIKK
ncbi:MAG: glycosyltransferase [Bacilli bacterium]|nr:glycosyltransferase [Bacilli bacterium]